jgi:hypothetical protein
MRRSLIFSLYISIYEMRIMMFLYLLISLALPKRSIIVNAEIPSLPASPIILGKIILTYMSFRIQLHHMPRWSNYSHQVSHQGDQRETSHKFILWLQSWCIYWYVIVDKIKGELCLSASSSFFVLIVC